jgi:hypothetical protein
MLAFAVHDYAVYERMETMMRLAKQRVSLKGWIVRTHIFLIGFVVVCLSSNAAARILENIEVLPDPRGSLIHIQLNTPVRVISHVPATHGDLLRIQLQPIPVLRTLELRDLTGRQTLLWSPTDRVPLIEVTYEGDRLQVLQPSAPGRISPGGRPIDELARRPDVVTGFAEVLLRFNRPVFYQVKRNGDPRRLSIYVLGAPEGEVEVPPTKEVPPEGEPGADDTGVPRTEEGGPSEAPGVPPVGPRGEAPAPGPDAGAVAGGEAARNLERARQAILDKDYSAAIGILTAALQGLDTRYRMEAQELLGLARERNGQLAHAKAEYERFLTLYPKGEPADRVRQRLAGLVTADQAIREKLRLSRQEEPQTAAPIETEVLGGFSQFYRRENQFQEGLGTDPLQSGLQSDLDLNAQRLGGTLNWRTRFSGGYLYDFLDDGPAPQTRVSSFYLDAEDKGMTYRGRVGRQTLTTGGVLGRFDGGTLGYRLNEWAKVNFVSGCPVEFSINRGIHCEKYFYGLNADLGTFYDSLDFNVFAIEQRADDLLDRRAIGGEMRYYESDRSLFALVDYDVSYSKLNTFLLLGTYIFENQATVNLILDHRTTPFLTTSNAIQGQPVDSLNALQALFPEDQIRRLAKDRTPVSDSVTLGGSYPLNERFLLNGDVMFAHVSETDASGGVPATPAVGVEKVYSTQLIGSNLFKEGDTSILGARFSDLDQTDITSLLVNTSYPVGPDLRISPTAQFDYFDNDDGTTDWTVFPQMRLTYLVKSRLQIELQSGFEWSLLGNTAGGHFQFHDYFVSLGYRYDF